MRQVVIDTTTGAFGEDAANAIAGLRRGQTPDLTQLRGRRDEFLRFVATLTEPEVGYRAGSLAAILRSTPSSLFLLANAHLLTERWSRDVLWEIRGVIQDDQRHSLVVTCPTEARETIGGAKAPFFGAGAIAEVGGDRDTRFWQRVARTHGLEVPSEDLEFVLARTWGLARPTLAVLLDAQSTGTSDALNQHIRDALDRIPVVLRMARMVTRYGPELLLRLSRGLPPYAIPSATARDISRALRQLGFHELVARVAPRGWRVADPFVSDALLTKPSAVW